MKKRISVIIGILSCVLLLVFLFSCTGTEEENPTSDEYFRFTLLDDGTYEISARYVDMPARTILPSTHEEKPITSIAVMDECTLILNNLHIRHNNETGKWENEIAKNMNTKEALEYCDLLYNKILQVVLMRKELKNQPKIDKLSKSLKK